MFKKEVYMTIAINHSNYSLEKTIRSQREDIINKSIGLAYGETKIPEEHKHVLDMYVDGFIELSDARTLMLRKIKGGGK